MLSLKEVCSALSAVRGVRGETATRFLGVSTDSRHIAAGDLFVALKGDTFDGHAFVEEARMRGAAALLVSRPVDVDLPSVEVDDTKRALGEIARMWRQRFDLPVIAVVGSNGKTTTKEMIAAILAAQHGDEGYHATVGNLNNDIGVPMTLLGLKSRHKAAVIELGMNHPNETAWLAAITEPTICLVTNAQREHQEFMESVAAVAREHALAITALSPDGVAVLPQSDVHVSVWREAAAPRRVLEYRTLTTADGAEVAQGPPAGTLYAVGYVAPFDTVAHMTLGEFAMTVHLQTAGMHNVHNAAGAASAALASGVDPLAVISGLEHFVPVKGRMQGTQNISGGLLIDDTYNANPDSVLAAIEVLVSSPAPHLLVLGDMGEVGAEGIAFHEEIGRRALDAGVTLMAIGPLMQNAARVNSKARHFDALPDLIEAATGWILAQSEPSSVLVKGSRFMGMERVAKALSRDTHAISEGVH
jgi:UDP-N-acetylmuramoyl-tripeptide--D-alanyl-D-alanine ligase